MKRSGSNPPPATQKPDFAPPGQGRIFVDVGRLTEIGAVGRGAVGRVAKPRTILAGGVRYTPEEAATRIEQLEDAIRRQAQ